MRAELAAWAALPSPARKRWQGGSSVRDAIVPELRRAGFARVRALDNVDRFSVTALEALLAAVCRHLGFLVPQNFRGDHVVRIQDEGRDYAAPETRGHQTACALAFHSDRCDLSLLLYVRAPAQGGRVSVVSYDEAVRGLGCQDPAGVAVLASGLPFDLRDERIFAEPRWTVRPAIWQDGSVWHGHYIRRFINDSQRHADCPRLGLSETQAMDRFDAVLDKLRPSNTFTPEPGEILALDNYRVLHAREAFRDSEQSAGRLALRAWVAPYDSRALPDFLLSTAGAIAPGSYRGGVGQGANYEAILGCTRAT